MVSAVGNDSCACASMNAVLRGLSDVSGGRPAGRASQTESARGVQGAVGKSELSDDERREVEELKKRDAEVRRHEAAHKAAAGMHARGGPTFEYQSGPDGRQYAVGGEVQIDTSEVPGDPQATIRKMQQVRRAALSPAEPSSQDQAVAAKAAQIEAEARAEKAKQGSNLDGPGEGEGEEGAAGAYRASAGIERAFGGAAAPDFASAGRFIDVRV